MLTIVGVTSQTLSHNFCCLFTLRQQHLIPLKILSPYDGNVCLEKGMFFLTATIIFGEWGFGMSYEMVLTGRTRRGAKKHLKRRRCGGQGVHFQKNPNIVKCFWRSLLILGSFYST